VSSLNRITSFVRNRFLNSKTEKDISHIAGFGSAAWNLIMSIYKSGWNALSINKHNRTFCQYISAQFKPNIKVSASHKKEQNPGKKADISRTSSFISLKPSMKDLAKSKFHKDKGKKPIK